MCRQEGRETRVMMLMVVVVVMILMTVVILVVMWASQANAFMVDRCEL